jgi:hypothetical protein
LHPISNLRHSGRGGKGKGLKGKGLDGSAPTFVTEDDGRRYGSDGEGGVDTPEEKAEVEVEVEVEVRGGLGSGARSGIGGGKQHQQQQAKAHQPITSNAAFAASLYQVSS